MEKLIRRIRACSAEKECYFALLLTSELFDMDNPCLSSLLETIRPRRYRLYAGSLGSGGKTYLSLRHSLYRLVVCGDRCARLNKREKGSFLYWPGGRRHKFFIRVQKFLLPLQTAVKLLFI